MNRVQLGNSGLSVSPVAIGTWQLSPRFWGEQSKDDYVDALRFAFAEGINLIDTANIYGRGAVRPGQVDVGAAERAVGESISGRRDRVLVWMTHLCAMVDVTELGRGQRVLGQEDANT